MNQRQSSRASTSGRLKAGSLPLCIATPTKSTRLTETDILTGGDILPGFAVPIADLFKDPLDD